MNKDIKLLLADFPLEWEDEFIFLNYADPFASTLYFAWILKTQKEG